MKKQRVPQQGNPYLTTEIKAERPLMVKPLIIREYFDKDGVRMYKTHPGGPYIADVYDKVFLNSTSSQQIKPDHYKGLNADKTKLWMK